MKYYKACSLRYSAYCDNEFRDNFCEEGGQS